MYEVKDIDLSNIRDFNELVKAYFWAGGFTARDISVATQVMTKMIEDDDCTVFLSFTGNMVATGLRGVIKTLVERRWVDVIITTVGTLDHDLARCWKPYYHGEFLTDDAKLLEEGKHRLGNIYVPRESYGAIIEEKLRSLLEELWLEGVRELSTNDLCKAMGEKLTSINSILYWATKNDIPIICPGPLDGAVGSQLWFFQQTHEEFKLDLFRDEQILSDLVFEANKTGALIVGGGIAKHHLLWWNQFREGLDYAIQISTALEWDGSLSGARLSEAMSWGKVSKAADKVNIWGEATVILPIIVKTVMERLEAQEAKKCEGINLE